MRRVRKRVLAAVLAAVLSFPAPGMAAYAETADVGGAKEQKIKEWKPEDQEAEDQETEDQKVEEQYTENAVVDGIDGSGVNLCIHHSGHTQDCGYSPEEDGAGSACAYECRICPIEELIAALPEQVTEDNRADAEARLQEILGLYTALTDEEAEQVDISRCMELQWQMDEASVPMEAVEMKNDITINSGNLSSYNNKEITGTLKNEECALTIDGVTVNLTISNLTLWGGTRGTVVLQNNATLNLTLKGSNTLMGYESSTAIKVPKGCTLRIQSIDGSDANSLTAIGGGGAAGIGASKYTGNATMDVQTVGTIIIDSGTVNAKGTYNGPGIGGTAMCTTGSVIINGGVVTATGSVGMDNERWGAAGIGGGLHGHLESITINGGTVTAKGTLSSADIGAGPNGNPAGNPTMECGVIAINGGTVNGGTIGFGRNEDAALIGSAPNSSIKIGENAVLPNCTVKPLPEDCESYVFKGTVYDTSITEKCSAVFSIGGGNKRNVELAVSDAEPYRGDFSVTVIMPKKASADASITFGNTTLNKPGVSLSDASPAVVFGTQLYQYYNIEGTIYDTKITADVTADVQVLDQTKTVTMKYRAPYSGTFRMEKIPLPKTYENVALSVTVTAGGNTWKGDTVGSGASRTLVIGEQKYKIYTLNGTINDTRITGDMRGTVELFGKTYQITLKETPPYAGTFKITDIPILIEKADAGFPVKVTLDGTTWDGTVAAGSETDKTLVIGEQKYKYYTLNGTIYDARLTGNVQGTVEALGSTQTVTLTKKGDYCAAFTAGNIPLPYPQADSEFSVTVKWGNGMEAAGTVSADAGTSKALTIGRPLQKVKLLFWDSEIRQDITVQSLVVTQNGTELGADVLAGGVTLQQSQLGTGYVELWIPEGTTDISITIPGLNGGNPIEGSGLEIGTGENEFELYREEVDQDVKFDLSYGDILFDGTGDNLTITYTDEGGVERRKANLSYDNVYFIGQSNAETATDHQIKVQNTTGELAVCLGGVNISRSGSNSPISIESGCTVNLQTAKGTENTAAGGGIPGVYVDPKAKLTLSGEGVLKAQSSGASAAIGGAGSQASGIITITSGTVEAEASGSGTGIGGGSGRNSSQRNGGDGTVIITGGTVRAVSSGNGAAIGGGGGFTESGYVGAGGKGTVTIDGGIVRAVCNGKGAAIGSGHSSSSSDKPTTVITINGGIVIADSPAERGYGSGIGSGMYSHADIIITGGTIKATAAGVVPRSGIGSGFNGTSKVTITGGTIQAIGAKDAAAVKSPVNGSTDVNLMTITLDGADDDVLVTEVSGIDGGYGLKDVYTRDGGKLYFYLPSDAAQPERITAGGIEYVPAGDADNNYVIDFKVELKDYAQTKVYDGKPMAFPTADQVICKGDTFENLSFAWYQNGTETDSPVNAGEYVLKASSDIGSQEIPVEITKKPLTITAQAQTVDYKTEISQEKYTHTELAEGDGLEVSLTAAQTAPGTHTGAITISSAAVARGGEDMTGNYEIACRPGDLTVNRIAPAVSKWPSAGEITYGQELGDSPLTGGNASAQGSFAWADASVKPEAGQKSYSVIFTPDDSNYDTVSGEAAITVNKAPLTIKAKDQEITYGQAIAAGTSQVTWEGLCTGDRLERITLTPSTADVPGGAIIPSEAGIRSDSAKDVTGNYQITYAEGKLTIAKAAGTLTVPGTSVEKVFGDEEFSLNCSTNGDGKISYASSDEKVVSVSAEGMVLIKGAGKASITFSLAEGANYTGGAEETITVNVAKAAAPSDNKDTRYYNYMEGSKRAVSVDAAGWLPENRGETKYSVAITDEKGILSDVSVDESGNLVYTVRGNQSEGDAAAITVTIEMANYENTKYILDIELVSKIIVEPQGGSGVPVSGSLTYGQRLSELALGPVVFVELGTDTEVKGVLGWKNPSEVPTVAARTAQWVFTPEDGSKYVELTGTAAIAVEKAVPRIEAPEAAAVTYHPSGRLDSVGLNGGSALWTVGADTVTVEGAWGWKEISAVPTVENSGYTALFTPKDTLNYSTAECVVTVPVAKAAPYIAVPPQAAQITYGDALESSGLTGGAVQYSASDSTPVLGGFTWKDKTVKPAVSDSGSTKYAVIFTPTETNYCIVETQITLTVERLENAPNMPSAVMTAAGTCEKVSDVELPKDWQWQDGDKEKVLDSGVPVTARAVYAGADKDNYKNVTVDVTITRAECVHENTELRNVLAADCRQEGYSGDTYCLDCGRLLAKGKEIGLKEHSGGTADCTSGKICQVCGTEYTEKDSGRHMHTEIRGEKEASCTADGYTGDTYCTDCNAEIGVGTVIPAAGHDWHITSEEAATETSEGRRVYTCSRCGQTYEESIPKLPPSHTPGHPFVKEDPDKEGWKAIKEETDRAEEKSTLNIDMNGVTVVPGEVLENIRGRDITITFDMGDDIIWSVNGTSVRDGGIGSIDFSVQKGTEMIPVEIINKVTGERFTIQISLAHEGEFGFTAVLSVNLGKQNAGLMASLYYYDRAAGEMEFVSDAVIAEDGTAQLAFSHASDYAIVVDVKEDDSEEEDGGDGAVDAPEDSVGTDGWDKVPKTGQPQEFWIAALLGIGTVMAGVYVFLAVRKKKEGEE